MDTTQDRAGHWAAGRGTALTRKRLLAATAALSFFAVLFGCEGEIMGPPGATATSSVTVSASLAGTLVAMIVVEVSAVDIPSPLVFNIPREDDQATGTVTVPVGDQREFRLTAFDSAGTETHRGVDTVGIHEGTNPTVVITLDPLTGEQPIDAVISSLFVIVDPSSDTIVIGESTALRAVVTNSAGDTLHDRAVQWASLDPKIATVDTLGFVLGRSSGIAQIVAIHKNIGGAAIVEVRDTSAPAVPQDLAATVVSSAQIDLTWNASSDDAAVVGYYIYRDLIQIADVAVVTYSDTGLNASTTYSYEVAAYDAVGNTSGRSALTSATTPAAIPGAPYPTSGLIRGMSFDWSTHDRRAPGSDNWPVTWADDGHQYTSWGDGGGFGGTNWDGRVSLGVARVEGSSASYTGVNVNGGVDPESGNSTLSGKSYGVLSLSGALYMWRSPGSDSLNWDWVDLYRSTDRGWSWSDLWRGWTESDGVGIPAFLQFGQDHAGARDGYVYSYFINIKDGSALAVQEPGEIVLARVPASQIEDRSAYQWFAGLDGSGQSKWVSDVASRIPVFEDANGVGWTVSVIYNPGLNRYLLATEHTETMVGNLGIFDAPEPWGPWTTVAYETNWPNGGQVQHSTFYWNFSAKWWSSGGQDFVLVFSGINENDTWNTVHGSFSLR